jgi:hypothetical protein
LTENPQSLTGVRMGRPPLKKNVETRPTVVRLDAETRERIEAIAGPNRMAVFIREAVEAELKRRERGK